MDSPASVRPPTIDDRIAATRRPAQAPVMFQRWRDLLFLHWAVDPETIADTLPPGLSVDLHDGKAWIGLVPFFMRGVRPRRLPAVGSLSNFLEMNVRTYVHDDSGRPGVWFYSLDANQPIAVRLARGLFHLPYFHADMSASTADGLIDYHCARRGRSETPSRFLYAGGDPLPRPEPGSLEFFLVERYFLFAWKERSKTLAAGQVHHEPYPVRSARCETFSTTALSQAGFPVGERPPDHALFSPGVEVDVFPLFTP